MNLTPAQIDYYKRNISAAQNDLDPEVLTQLGIPVKTFATPNPRANAKTKPIKDHAEMTAPDGLLLTPMGNSERVVRDFGDDIRWTEGTNYNSAGVFYNWTGQRWQPDNSAVLRYVKKTMRGLEEQFIEASESWLPDALKELRSFWKNSEGSAMVSDVLKLLRTKRGIAIDRGIFDADPLLVGLENGTLDLKTYQFREPNRDDLITKTMRVNYQAAAECPLWLKFLEETTDGDKDLQLYLQRCAGYCLTGLTEQEVLFLVVGKGGTGKSTFAETLNFIWHDYAANINPESLAASKNRDGGRPRADIAKLAGARIVFANETRSGMQLDEGLVKQMTGRDTLTARFLYQNEFEFVPQFKLWFRTNVSPLFDGSDSGMRRRLKLIPFEHVPEVKDIHLGKKLRTEASGILNWAVEGLKAYQADGLNEPKVVSNNTDDYLKTLDPIQRFIDACCAVDPSFTTPSGELYQRYLDWSRSEKILNPVGVKRFVVDMKSRGFEQKKTKMGMTYVGLR